MAVSETKLPGFVPSHPLYQWGTSAAPSLFRVVTSSYAYAFGQRRSR